MYLVFGHSLDIVHLAAAAHIQVSSLFLSDFTALAFYCTIGCIQLPITVMLFLFPNSILYIFPIAATSDPHIIHSGLSLLAVNSFSSSQLLSVSIFSWPSSKLTLVFDASSHCVWLVHSLCSQLLGGGAGKGTWLFRHISKSYYSVKICNLTC